MLDLGAGTGKLTKLLVERYPDVHAVEPLAGMRAVLERTVPEAEVLCGNAERIPLDDASVDAVFVAEAFHWFDSDAAVREIARVLRPGGTLVICFNEWRAQWSPPIGDAARAAIEERAATVPAPGGPKVAAAEWKRGFAGAPFGPLTERTVDHDFETDADGVAAYYVSISSLAQLPPDEREALREQVVAALAETTYTLELTARVFTTVRT